MSMMKRSNPEITAEILSLCKQPQKKTQVMYKTNLSWEMSQRYLSQLLSKGFLEIHHSHIRYATTPKGLRFLDKWRELMQL
jgi:predicted transcriptional regulator